MKEYPRGIYMRYLQQTSPVRP